MLKMSPVKKIYLLFGAAVLSVILHNAFYGIFGVEEPVFFTLTFIFALAFAVSVIYNAVSFFRKGEPKDLWKLGFLGFFGLVGLIPGFGNGFFGFFGFFGFLGTKGWRSGKIRKKSVLIMFAIIVLSFAVGIHFYPLMPERMASHWNIHGQVDGYIPKFWGLFLMPIISFVLLLLFLLIPKIDPLKANIEKFRKYFDGFIILIILFLSYIYLLTILWNLGVGFNMNFVLPPAFGILLFYCGILIEKAKRNWFIGIRTPWTLSSDKVWEKTHKVGGKLFKIAGLIALVGILFPNYTFLLILIPVLIAVIYTTVYSYFEYRKEMKNDGSSP